ncbi:ankyrin [Setomelanomma holmii]|uniref:Ankyrin n=1 Tax=Setomelanomma holmii TaxID=210430 RepID=A0A9P4LMF4_9PLEO|nr:ankyrin [Setomelanomma holmii]
MRITDLPLKVFHEMLYRSIQARVNVPRFAAAYLERRVLKELADGVQYDSSLPRIFQDDRYYTAADFEAYVYVAAWLGSERSPATTSSLFGSSRAHVEKYGSFDLLAKMMTYDHATHSACQSLRLNVFIGVAGAGRADATRFAFDFHRDKYPWIFLRKGRPKYARQSERYLASLETPSKGVSEGLMEKRKLHCTTRQFGPEQWTQFLHTCASKGWSEMAVVYLRLGASVEDQLDTTRITVRRPLVEACLNGHQEIVRILLGRGVSVSPPAVASAAQKGHVTIIQTLLDNGAEFENALPIAVAKGYTDVVSALFRHGAPLEGVLKSLLTHAVKRDYKALFSLLLDHRSDPSIISTTECIAIAKANGLESMLELLDEMNDDVLRL